jgi:hypothetical protein
MSKGGIQYTDHWSKQRRIATRTAEAILLGGTIIVFGFMWK